MKTIILQPTRNTPRVVFNTNGLLLFEGNSVPRNVNELFSPLLDFATHIKVPEIVFDINLKYFNTSSAKRLLDLLLSFDANKRIKRLIVNWHYEESDQLSWELAEVFKECVSRMEIRYVTHLLPVLIYEQRVKDIYI